MNKKSLQQQRGEARTKLPQRAQVEMQFLSLDQWLDPDHRVRMVWQYVESLDLTELYQSIKATRDNVGRDAIDPQILFALWLFGTIEGTLSARRIDELTRRDIAYMWICGGVSVNYHRLSDFRAQHGERSCDGIRLSRAGTREEHQVAESGPDAAAVLADMAERATGHAAELERLLHRLGVGRLGFGEGGYDENGCACDERREDAPSGPPKAAAANM